jgi:hypothetical protein
MRELYPNKGKRGRKGKTLIDLLAWFLPAWGLH